MHGESRFVQIECQQMKTAVIAAMEQCKAPTPGKLDILVNAAGIEIEKTIEETSTCGVESLVCGQRAPAPS